MSKSTIKSICAAIAATSAAVVLATAPTSTTKFVPDMINYQGEFKEPSSGNKYADGIYTLDCRLYRAQSGGTAIWGARYSVYVKDGYFNIMLGDPSGTAIKSTVGGTASTTYAPGELWRALWYDSSVSEKNNLWLGVTPHQGANNSPLSTLREISPRQQLLAAPYAFRAHAAEYAERSIGNFNVSGSLSVSGELTLPTTYNLGHVHDSSTILKLGGTSNAADNPTNYLYAGYLYNYGYNGIYSYSSAGDIRFVLASSKSLKINSGNFAVTNTATTMKSSGSTKIEAGTSISILPATNSFLYGQGKVSWKAPGRGTTCRPMKLKSILITVASNNSIAYSHFANKNTNPNEYYDYVWTVAGYEVSSCSPQDPPPTMIGCYCFCTDSDWALCVDLDRNVTPSSRSWKVHLLGINKAFVDDDR